MRRLVLKCVWSLPGGCDDENNNLDYNGVDFDDNNDGNDNKMMMTVSITTLSITIIMMTMKIS